MLLYPWNWFLEQEAPAAKTKAEDEAYPIQQKLSFGACYASHITFSGTSKEEGR